MQRRHACAAAALSLAGFAAKAAPRGRLVRAPAALRLIAAGAQGVLAVDAQGSLWLQARAGAPWQPVAQGLDPHSPLALGAGRVAARTADGGLFVWEAGRSSRSPALSLAPHAGLLVLPLAVIAVALQDGQARLVRLEPGANGRWQVVARSAQAVLPDARPVLADLDGRGDGGHVVVLADPDRTRYAHGVLGDAIEAVRLQWLERHSLGPLRELTLPAPHVFEDIAPRPVSHPALGLAQGLLTVRAGPEGGQLALVTADRSRADRLQLSALGDSVGGRHRWLAPTTSGPHWLAVHTPHLGGVLHDYRWQGDTLARRKLLDDVSTHRIGSRELDLALWLGDSLLMPSQDQRRLRLFDAARGFAPSTEWALPAPAVMTRAWPEAGAALVLLDSGELWAAEGW